MHKLLLLSTVLFIFPTLAAAQVLEVSEPALSISQQAPSAPAKQATESSQQAQTAASSADENLTELPPVQITPEQKIYARREMQKSIKRTVSNADVRQRRGILDAVETLQKIKNRRENLNKSPEEQVPYKDPQVNASSKQDVQKYLQETFVDTLDDSFKTPDQEQ